MPVLVVGSIALDHIKTPTAEHSHLLGGSASYAGVAASFFGPVHLVGVIGDDFPPQHRELFARRKIDLTGLEVAAGKTHHDHMTCLRCGAVLEFVSPAIERLQRAEARRRGFVMQGHALEITGLCRCCAAARSRP